MKISHALLQEMIDQEVQMALEDLGGIFEQNPPVPEEPAADPMADLGAETAPELPDSDGADGDLGDLGGELGDDLGAPGDVPGEPGLEGEEGTEDADLGGDLGGGGGLPSFGGGGGGGGGMDFGGDDTGEEDAGTEEGGDDSGGGSEMTGDPVEDTFSEAEQIATDTENPQKVLNLIKSKLQDKTLSSMDQIEQLSQKLADSENAILHDASKRLRIFIDT